MVALADYSLCYGLIGSQVDKKEQAAAAVVKEDKGECTMAFIISKTYVTPKLAAPRTADFPFSDFKCSRKDNTYQVFSYVECKNLFNVPLKYNYVVQMQFIGGDSGDPKNWRLLDIQMQEAK